MGGLAGLGCLLAVACTPSLASVRATSGLGVKLSAFETAFDLAGTHCHYADLVGAVDPLCAALDADVESWHAVNRALVGYAAALGAMADDSTDRSQETNIATALGATAQVGKPWSDALGANVTSGVSTGVATLVSGIVGVYRRERLGQTIRSSDDALQAVAHGIDQNVLLLDRADQNLIATIKDTISSVRDGSSPAAVKQGLAMSLASVAAELAAHRIALASYQRAIDSFAKAHHDVREKVSGLGDPTADLELLKIIAADVVTIVKSVDTATTPLVPTPPVTP